jgi:hypothetical protein
MYAKLIVWGGEWSISLEEFLRETFGSLDIDNTQLDSTRLIKKTYSLVKNFTLKIWISEMIEVWIPTHYIHNTISLLTELNLRDTNILF